MPRQAGIRGGDWKNRRHVKPSVTLETGANVKIVKAIATARTIVTVLRPNAGPKASHHYYSSAPEGESVLVNPLVNSPSDGSLDTLRIQASANGFTPSNDWKDQWKGRNSVFLQPTA